MFLEFIRNLPENFRKITREIQEFPSKKLETFLKNSESKKKKKKCKRLRVGFDATISCLAVEKANHFTVRDLFQASLKYNMRVNNVSRDCGVNFSKISLEHA